MDCKNKKKKKCSSDPPSCCRSKKTAAADMDNPFGWHWVSSAAQQREKERQERICEKLEQKQEEAKIRASEEAYRAHAAELNAMVREQQDFG